MVIAHHAIFTAYGFWLPNDLRGSWSDFVRSWELLRFGPATKTDTRRSVAAADHDHTMRHQAKEHLRYAPVVFTGLQARAIARGFAESIAKSGYVLHACSILPDHVHLVAARHAHHIETIVGQLKGAATKRLKTESLHPEAASPWARRCWKVFLNTEDDIRRAIAYVERNPMKEKLPPQRWLFVTPFSGGATPRV
jgi:REP element-mobilizing transposase RayT